jgi:protoporphyrinogen oxidase
MKCLGADPEELYWKSYQYLNLTRVLVCDEQKTRDLKANSEAFDIKIGYHHYQEGFRPQPSYYPKVGGNQKWITALEQQLLHAGIKVITSEKVTDLDLTQSTPVIKTKNSGNFTFDRIYWAAGERAFTSILGNSITTQVDTPKIATHRYTSHIHLVLDRKPTNDLDYVLINDPNLKSFRVTQYSNIQQEDSNTRGRYKVTIEIISEKIPDAEILYKTILDELMEFRILSPEAKILEKSVTAGHGTIPAFTNDFVNKAISLRQELERKMPFLKFIGLLPGETFFKNEVLRHTHQLINKTSF